MSSSNLEFDQMYCIIDEQIGLYAFYESEQRAKEAYKTAIEEYYQCTV